VTTAGIGPLRLNDGVEIAAIGDVDRERSEVRHLDRDALPIQPAGDVADPHGPDPRAVLHIVQFDRPRRDLGDDLARRARGDQAVFKGEGDDADGAVAAHRQDAAGLDEQDADIGLRRGRRIEETAAHHVVAAGLETQAGADPVIAGHEVLPPRAHAVAGQRGRAFDHQPHGIAGGMAVDAAEDVPRHR
jgi:hypothetical protein